MVPLPSFIPGTPKTEAAGNSMEDFTETEDREIAPMEAAETGEIIEIGPLGEKVTETDQRADMTGIIIMIGTIEEDEEMDFSRQKRE